MIKPYMLYQKIRSYQVRYIYIVQSQTIIYSCFIKQRQLHFITFVNLITFVIHINNKLIIIINNNQKNTYVTERSEVISLYLLSVIYIVILIYRSIRVSIDNKTNGEPAAIITAPLYLILFALQFFAFIGFVFSPCFCKLSKAKCIRLLGLCVFVVASVN